MLKQSLRTAVFIDGYNLYYGALKGTQYKWLNLYSFVEEIIRSQHPIEGALKVNYYTAMVKARIATHGEEAVKSQQAYHKALKSEYTPQVELICSHHILEKATPMKYIEGMRPDKNNRCDVWKIEEKQTDVRIAIDAIIAALSGAYDQIVVVSNDTDLIPLFETIKLQTPDIIRGLIVPRKDLRISSTLTVECNWVRHKLNESELANHQLPKTVPTKKKPAYKPVYW